MPAARHAAALFLAALVTLTPAAAQDLPPQRFGETVIVTASALEVPFDNVGRAVQVLTREQIERLPVRSIADLLRLTASVDVRARGPWGVQSDFLVRGAGFGQTLVLVDGLRINDLQSGHHNGDIPVPLEDIERIEILYGAGSSLYGADAVGGTINIITRTAARRRRLAVSVGEFGFVDASGTVGVQRSTSAHQVTVSGNRSNGFMFARDFWTVDVSARSEFRERLSLHVGHVQKEFGANGFYGPSPSREWTSQTLASVSRSFGEGEPSGAVRAAYRTHGDRFLWDSRRPGVLENRHRTHAVQALIWGRRPLGNAGRIAARLEGGGDWIRSNNLGDHTVARVSASAELQQGLGDRVLLHPGLRFDAYSQFGSAWSPSLAASVWVGGAKLRASLGRAFRVPTFTERYYSDPNHAARADLAPERGWSGEVGVDWTPAEAWLLRGTVFARRERDVIDWIRASSTERWQTTNIHRVETVGAEVGARFSAGERHVDLQYTVLDAEAGAVAFLSKYRLDYARHALTLSASGELPGQITVGPRLDYRRRVDGRDAWVLDARISRRVGVARLFVEGSNLLDETYEEIAGVAMPGRWIRAGLALDAF